jgi:hypothetical protein
MDIDSVLERHGIPTTTLDVLIDAADTSIYTLLVPGRIVVTSWRQLRLLVPQLGYWPVILGDRQDVSQLLDWRTKAVPTLPQAIIADSHTIEPQQWLAEQAGYATYPGAAWFVRLAEDELSGLREHYRSLGYDDERYNPLSECLRVGERFVLLVVLSPLRHEYAGRGRDD